MPKVSSCCGAETSVFRDYESLKEYFRCVKCGQPCQLVDKPVEPELMICQTTMCSGVDCRHKEKHNFLPECNNQSSCYKCVPYTEPVVAQSSPSLDKLMPLVYGMSLEDGYNNSFAEGKDAGCKQQNTADKAITARLLAEKDAEIVELKEEISEILSTTVDTKVYLKRIKELEAICGRITELEELAKFVEKQVEELIIDRDTWKDHAIKADERWASEKQERIRLQNYNANLEAINEQHRVINGELRTELRRYQNG